MKLFISPEWEEALAKENLNSLDKLLNFQNDNCCSRHSCRAIWKHTLQDGRVIFIKRTRYTKFNSVLRQLIHFTPPRTSTEREADNLDAAKARGFVVPEIVASSRHCWWELPKSGVIVEAAFPGYPLDVYAADPSIPLERRQAKAAAARELLIRLQDCRLDWKRDCKPEHFFVLDDGAIGILDLERMYLRRRPLSAERRQRQLARFDSLLPSM